MSEQRFEIWGIIEIMGHTKLAGKISEASIGGIPMVRVDVPEVDNSQAFTRFYGKEAIFSIQPCDEETTKLAAVHIQEPPVTVYLPQLRSLSPSPSSDQGWLCTCGNYQEDDFHCSECGAEPPWGCACDDCQEKHYDETYYPTEGIDELPFDNGAFDENEE